MENVDFVGMLMDMRSGKVAVEVSQKLNRLIRAIMETGKPGKLSLTLAITPKELNMQRGVSQVEVSHKCSIVEPEMSIGPSLFYTTHDAGLSRKDPDQMEMDYEEVRNG